MRPHHNVLTICVFGLFQMTRNLYMLKVTRAIYDFLLGAVAPSIPVLRSNYPGI